MARTFARWGTSFVAGALLVGAASAQTVSDTALFTTVVPPNVMLIVDNSGSMNNVVWHPTYSPTATTTCHYFDDTVDYFVNSTDSDTFPNGGSNTQFRAGTYTISSTGCVTTPREIFVDPTVNALPDYTRWDGHYLNWYYSAANATAAAQIVATNNGTYSSCLGGGTYNRYRRARITAAKAVLNEVICQVNAAGAVRFGIAEYRRVGGGNDPNGGYVKVPINDYLVSGSPNVYTLNGVSRSHAQHLSAAIGDLTSETWTPSAETLFQVYSYFYGRGAAQRPAPRVSGTFPAYQYDTSWSTSSSNVGGLFSSSSVPPSPVQYDCQKNFVVYITDGEPTKDTFVANSPSSTAAGFSSFNNLIGDYNADGENETSIPASCNCDSSASQGTLYLDDIAKFMHEKDFRPDMADPNGVPQTIDVYTVGFTTNAFANALLAKTAAVGGGQFYTSNDPDQLANDIVSAVSDIVRKSQSFTAATVPAARTSSGGMFYTSRFVPSTADGFWEGHLEAWKIDLHGFILDSAGACALNDPEAPAECSTGSFKSSAVPFWDAGARLRTRSEASRKLWTSLIDPTLLKSKKIAWTSTNFLPTDLNITLSDLGTYNFGANPVAGTIAALQDDIVATIRGCELGTLGGTCVDRPWKLGDLFHSDPVVVPGPPSPLAGAGNKMFRQTYGTRDRRIFVGSNDAFLHAFDAGSWNATAVPPAYTTGSGDEVFGFMPYTARKTAKELPRDSGTRDFYMVDGSPHVSDAWFYSSPTSNTQLTDGSEWRTILISGMRQGGKQLFALDVTNPGASAVTTCPNSRSPVDTGYPCYLWEYPRENGPTSDKQLMGETWSEPVIVKIKVKVNSNDNGGQGFERWVAIVGGGYDKTSNPNDKTNYNALSYAGRTLMVIDVQTGKMIARKEFDPASTAAATTDPSTIAYDPAHAERSMHYAFAATPAVFDLDFDGYADVVYAPDVGGNIWKWVIKDLAWDSVNSASTDYDQDSTWKFSLFFKAPTWLNTSTGQRWWKSFFYPPTAVQKNGKLWVALGSGERANLGFTGSSSTTLDNNRFYSVQDIDPLDKVSIASPLLESNLLDVTSLTGCPVVSPSSGFFFSAAEGEKFVTPPEAFNYFVLTASYTPTGSSTPCTAGGDAKIYGFKITCAEGLFTGPSASAAANDRSVSIGSGLPTAPQITITTDPNGQSSIVVNNQNGDLIDPSRPQCTTPPCPSACDPATNPNCVPNGGAKGGTLYWREVSN
jgi:type IV pilus assembly protein PilY1